MKTLALAIGFGLLLAPAGPVRAANGKFLGNVVVKWIDDDAGPDREMLLMEPFGFRDANGSEWWAPKGAKIDGASIPRVLWSTVGSPFTGDYRRASVVHDYYCETKERPWQAVHRMFYEGVLAAGVPQRQAKVLYAAVYGGGPRWSPIAGAEPGEPAFITITPDLSEKELRELETWIEAVDPDLATLERRVQAVVSQ